MNDFWLKWRREIVRGGVLFVAVVAVGLWATNLVRGGRARVMSELRNTLGALSVDFDAPGRTHGDTWQWRGPLTAAQTIRIRNMNGPISVERTPGSQAEVLVEKSWEHSTPQSVRLVALPGTSGVTICALWGDQASCNPEGHYEAVGGGGHRSDVAVRFKVLVPKGVAADVTTMNGALQITGVTGALNATTLTIGGSGVSYNAVIANGTGGTLSVVFIQAYIDQGAGVSRAAGGADVTCGPNVGDLPPGSCNYQFDFFASNASGISGTGTLVPGSATARFELRRFDSATQTTTVLDTRTVAVTLN